MSKLPLLLRRVNFSGFIVTLVVDIRLPPMRPSLFWDFTERVLVVCYRRFGITLPSYLQRLRVLFSLSLSYTVFSFLVFLFPFISPLPTPEGSFMFRGRPISEHP